MNATDPASAVAGLEAAQKGFDERAARRSVVAPRTPEEGQFAPGYELGNLMLWVGGQADEIETWGRNVKRRDRQLREFVPTENVFASALGTIVARNAAFDFSVEGPPRTASRVHDILENANNGKGWVDFVSKVSYDLYTQDSGAFFEIVRDGDSEAAPLVGINHLDAARCLGRDSRVLMADGSTKAILELVRSRDPGPVMALGPGGRLEAKNVVDWHESPLGDRYWLRLRLKGARHVFGRREGLWLTNDHEVLTQDGWQRTEHLGLGTKIITQFPSPNPEQMELLVGMLLGDASMGGTTPDRSFVALGHARKQEGWLDLKKEALAGFRWSATRGQTFRQTSTEVSPGLADLRRAFYPEGKKVVPRDLVERCFGPRLLAAWYGDDGTMRDGKWGRPRARLYTYGFAEEDSEWLAELLTRKGYAAHTFKRRMHVGPYAGSVHTGIYVSADGAEKLFRDVAPYLPTSLRHRLPNDARPLDPSLWNLGRAERWAAEIESLERGDNGEQTATFCIDVEENHNFIAGGMVVHNCWHTGIPQEPVLYQDRLGRYHLLKAHQVQTLADLPVPHETLYGLQLCGLTRLLRACQIIKAINQYKYEKVSGRHTRAIHFVRGVPTAQITAALAQMNIAADRRATRSTSSPS